MTKNSCRTHSRCHSCETTTSSPNVASAKPLNMFVDYTMKNWFWILCEVVFGVILVLAVEAVWLLIMAGVAYLIFICVGCFDRDKHSHICGSVSRRTGEFSAR